MSTLRRWALAASLAILACPEPGLTQEPVGVVTTLAGQATRTASAPGETPAPLRFKDGVFGADTIRTAERSFVRVLLERKAVLTVRELSVLRITEDATQAAVDLKAGGIAFSVARPRLRPGETVLVRTPNAVAAVRGTTIVVETQGAVTHFHVLTGALDVAAHANPTAWQRLQAPASLTVTGSVVGTPRGLDDATRDRLTADYLSLRVTELSAPAEMVAQEQVKAVLLARLISGDGTGGDQVEMLAVTDAPVPQTGAGMQSPTQVPVTSPVGPGTPTVAAVPVPPPPPIQSWINQTATVTGDLLNVPAAATSTLASSLASASGSTVTVTNEVVDVTGTLTASAAGPFVALQSSTLASRTLALVQTGSLTLTGGPLLEAVGGGASTTDDLLRVTGGGRLVGPAGAPLLSLSGITLGVGNGTGDRLLELTGAGSRLSLGGALLDATGSTVSLTGTSLVEVTTGAALDVAGASLVNLTGGALVLNGAATGFLFSSTTPSTLGGGLLDTSGTDINAGIAAPGNLLSVSGPLTSAAATPLLSLSGGDVRARNLGVVSSATGVLTLGGAFLDRAGAGNTLVSTDDLLNVSAGGRLVAGGADALLRFTDTTVNAGNGSGDQLFQLTGAGSTATLGAGLLESSNTAFTLTGSSLVDVSTGAVLTATGAGPLATLSGGSLALGSATGFAFSSTGASQIAGSLLRTTGTGITTTGDLVSVSGPLTSTGTTPLLDLDGAAVAARNGVLVSTVNGRLTLNGPALVRTGGTLATTDDLFNVSGGARLTSAGTGALLGFSGASVTVGSGDQLFVVTGAGSTATLAGALLDASATTFTLTGASFVEVSSGATLTAPAAAPLTSLSGGALNLGGGTGFLVSSTSPSTVGGSLLRTTGADVTTTGNLVTVSGSLTDTGAAALLDLTGGAGAARNGFALSSASGQLGLNGPALSRAGGTLTVTDDLVNISAGGRLTSAGAGALLGFSGATVNVGNGSGDQLFQLTGAGSTATLAGGLLEASTTAFTLTGSSLVDVSTGAVLSASGAVPLAALSDGSLALGNATGFVFSSTGASQIAGSLLRTTNTGVTTTGDLVSVSGTLTDTGTAALLDLGGGAVAGRSGVLVSTANGRLSLNGPALSRTGGTLTLTDDLVSITSGGRLTDTGAGPLLAFSAGTVNIGNAAGDQLFVVNGAGSRATLAGPVLSATGTALSLTGTALVEVSTSGTLTDAATGRLVSLSGGSLTLGSATSAVLVNTTGTASLAGGLLDASGTDITAAGDFVRALGVGRIVVTGSSAPLLSLTGGTHQFGATGNIYRLSGTATAIDPLSGLLLGTEEPIQAVGSLFESVGATATTQRAVRLDVALLQASAPLLSLRNNGAVAGGLTTTSNAIDLTSRAKLNATAPVIALDGSRITVTNASLVNVAGGSYLGVTGNLLSVANGSQISVTGGTLLFAAGGSVVNISGALLSFGGSGSTVTVSNALCPCTIIGGIPVRLSGGALAANVSITNPIKNAAGNTVSFGAGAAVRVDGATTRVTISGQ
jgi:FecR-like protein